MSGQDLENTLSRETIVGSFVEHARQPLLRWFSPADVQGTNRTGGAEEHCPRCSRHFAPSSGWYRYIAISERGLATDFTSSPANLWRK